MARYDNLPVYKSSYDLLIRIFEFCRGFTREYKYTLGEKLKDEALELIVDIYRANVSEQKSASLARAREHAEVVRLLLRLTKDLKQIDLKKFALLNDNLEGVSRQLTGWQRSLKKAGMAGAPDVKASGGAPDQSGNPLAP